MLQSLRSGVPRSLGEVGLKKNMYFVYILKSKIDGSRYIGVTTNLKRRLREHNTGSSKYCNSKRPYILTWFCAFSIKEKAYKFELYLKSSSGHAFAKKHFI